MSSFISVGIGGFGRSGCDIHARYLRDDPRFRVVAVADQLPERRDDAARMFGCRVYDDYAAMLAAGGFDLFVNATPSRLHVAASLAGFAAGCNVVGEKPTAATVIDFDRIVVASENAGRLFFPFQNSRFYPYFRKIREVIASGVLGRIIAVRSNWSGFGRRWDWQTLRAEQGGNLFNTGPHPVDQGIVLFGEGTPRVFCRMDTCHYGFGGDAESYCALTLYDDGAPTVEIQVSSFQAYAQGEQYNIQGTCGGLTGGPAGVRWKYFDPARAPKHELWRPWSEERKFCGEALEWVEETWETPAEELASGLLVMTRGFYDNLYSVSEEGGEREIRLEQVRRQVAVIEEAYRQNPDFGLPPPKIKK